MFQQLQGHTVATDVDLERDYVFWTDVSFKNRGIYRAKYSDGSQIVRIISSGKLPNTVSLNTRLYAINFTYRNLHGHWPIKTFFELP